MSKFIYRLPPCPYYDLPGVESWLEELSAKGLHLDPEGFVFGVMQFQRNEAKSYRYRLEAVQKQQGMLWEKSDIPPEDTLEFYQDMGWEFVTRYHEFYIYRSDDPNAPELHTDPVVQASTMTAVIRRNTIILLSFMLILGCLILINHSKGFLMYMAHEGWSQFFWLCIFEFIGIASITLPLLHLHRVKKRLKLGIPLSHKRNWRIWAIPYRIWVFLFIFLFFIVNSRIFQTEPEITPVSPSDSPFPIVTMNEMFPELTYIQDEDNTGYMDTWSVWQFENNYIWSESGKLLRPDHSGYSGNLVIYYHEAGNPYFAEKLTECYLKEFTTITYTPDPDAAANYGFDYMAVYTNLYSARILIRDGNTVIKVICGVHDWGGSDLQYPLFLELLSEKMA